jgi:hypothetical protein
MTHPAGAIPVRDLLARASSRESILPGDARGGAVFEGITIDGTAYFVKRLCRASDWIMRVAGDQVHRPYLVWRAGSWTGPHAVSITPWWRWTWTARVIMRCSAW